jgi:hypothetical protein
MQIVPLQPLPNQTMQVQLGNQACTIGIFQYAYGLFLSLSIGGQAIVSGQICENLVLMVREKYLGFSGDLTIIDTQGSDDPNYTQLGSRFQLIWLEPADLSTT